MRFMSILGLCLMAVFALVQSLPLQEAEPVQQAPERAQLHQDIAMQQQRAQVLKAELERLRLLIEQANVEKAETDQALTEAGQQLANVVDQAQQTRSEQLRLSNQLKQLQKRLERGRYTLASLQQAADDEAQSLRSLQQRLHLEQRKLDDVRHKARELERQRDEEKRKRETIRRQERAAKLQQAHTKPSLVIENSAPPETKKGFTLRFASDEALQHQVATGGVSLYAMADKEAWRLSLQHGRPVFADVAFPQWFHEMAASTVPVAYVRQLESTITPSARGAVVWGVQLPTATKRDIASLTRSRQGGDLVIAANGRVTLAAE